MSPPGNKSTSGKRSSKQRSPDIMDLTTDSERKKRIDQRNKYMKTVQGPNKGVPVRIVPRRETPGFSSTTLPKTNPPHPQPNSQTRLLMSSELVPVAQEIGDIFEDEESIVHSKEQDDSEEDESEDESEEDADVIHANSHNVQVTTNIRQTNKVDTLPTKETSGAVGCKQLDKVSRNSNKVAKTKQLKKGLNNTSDAESSLRKQAQSAICETKKPTTAKPPLIQSKQPKHRNTGAFHPFSYFLMNLERKPNENTVSWKTRARKEWEALDTFSKTSWSESALKDEAEILKVINKINVPPSSGQALWARKQNMVSVDKHNLTRHWNDMSDLDRSIYEREAAEECREYQNVLSELFQS